MRKMTPTLFAVLLSITALPAYASGDAPFFSLNTTNFVVAIAFVLFLGILAYFKIPKMLGGMLDKRAAEIKANLDEAKQLREDAQELLASFERKQKEMQKQSENIVATAREEADRAKIAAKQDIKDSIARRLQTAQDQIKSAEISAIRRIKDQAASVAISAASAVIEQSLTSKESNNTIDDAIAEVANKLH